MDEDLSAAADDRELSRGASSPYLRALLPFLLLAAVSHVADVSHGLARLSASNRFDASARASRRGFGGSRGALLTPQPGPRLSPTGVATFGDAPFYDPKTLRTVFIQFPGDAWEAELERNYRRDTEVAATVTIDGKVYRDVGVRFRGNSSYRMVSAGFKRSLNLSLDAVHADQEVGGYNTLNLLNGNGDPTFVRTLLYAEIGRQYLPVPRVNFVRIAINGESWGVYLNVQQFNKDFLRDFFGTTQGVRWKVPGSPRGRGGLEYLGDAAAHYRSLYELKTKESEKAWSDLIRLCRLLNTTSPEDLEAVLGPHLDIDGALKFLALEIALVNTDGYWTRASDYSLYQDPGGKFHVLPHDFNEAMGVDGPGSRRGGGHGGPLLDPLVGLDDASKPLRSRLLAVPALRQRYLAHVRTIAEKSLDWQAIGPSVREYQSLIEADVKADGRKLYGFDRFDPAALEGFFRLRREFLLR